MAKRTKLPTDASQRGKAIVDLATGASEAPDVEEESPRGRAGGQKGGKARSEKLTPARRSEIAKKAAQARWSGKPSSGS